MKITTVILAAGKGSRMRSELPKVLHKIAHKPLLQHVYELSSQLNNNSIKIVYGHGGDLVKEALQGINANWAEQKQQLGTGHAVQQVADQIEAQDIVLILYGDVPLLKLATVEKLIALVSDKSI